jgi:hypothetical protein
MKLVGLFVCYDWVRKRGVWHNMGCFESCSVVVYICIAKIYYMGYRAGFGRWANGFTYTEVQ